MSKKVFCTIITKNYLGYARTLYQSLIEHNPNSVLYVLLADFPEQYFEPEKEEFNWIFLSDLKDQKTIKKMCFYYNGFELSCALRGHLHEYIYQNTSADKWIFLDADILVVNPLDSIFLELDKTSILLTPHRSTPAQSPYIESHELSFLKAGTFNAGFLAIKRNKISLNFIEWFKARLNYYCFDDHSISDPRGLFVDQLWLNLATIYFKEDLSFFLHKGANLGHWNISERQLRKTDNGELIVDNDPLLFIHFSGFDINHPEKISKYAPVYDSQESPELRIWKELAEIYAQKLKDNDYEQTKQYPYSFNHFVNGEPINSLMRRIYFAHLRHDIEIAKTDFDDPFVNYKYFVPYANYNDKFIITENVTLLKENLRRANLIIHRLEQKVLAMEASKFMKLRNQWIKFKQFIVGIITFKRDKKIDNENGL